MNAEIIQLFRAEINGYEFTNETEYNEVKNAIKEIEKLYRIKVKTFKGVAFVKDMLCNPPELICEGFYNWCNKIGNPVYNLVHNIDIIKTLKIIEKI